MVNLVLKNLKETDAALQNQVTEICEEKKNYYSELFKKYDKDLTLEVIFNKNGDLYKTSASLNMKSKKILLAEENKDLIKTVNAVFSALKNAVKRQYEIEKKEYEYKKNRKKK